MDYDSIKRYDVSTLKKRLSHYKELEREIENQLERLENIDAKMYTIGSPELTDMPKADTVVAYRIGNLVAKKEELLGQIQDAVSKRDEERRWIERVLNHVENSNQRAVIRMRYIDSETWDSVAFMLFGAREDYPNRIQTYLRRTTKLHGTALVSMVHYLNGGK